MNRREIVDLVITLIFIAGCNFTYRVIKMKNDEIKQLKHDMEQIERGVCE